VLRVHDKAPLVLRNVLLHDASDLGNRVRPTDGCTLQITPTNCPPRTVPTVDLRLVDPPIWLGVTGHTYSVGLVGWSANNVPRGKVRITVTAGDQSWSTHVVSDGLTHKSVNVDCRTR